jgi:hypothetical protein
VCRERASGRAGKKDDELAASHSALSSTMTGPQYQMI